MQEVGVIIQSVGKSFDIVSVGYIKQHISVQQLSLETAVYAYISLYIMPESRIFGAAAAFTDTELAVLVWNPAAYLACDYTVKASYSLGSQLEVRAAVAGYGGGRLIAFYGSVIAGYRNISGNEQSCVCKELGKGYCHYVVSADYSFRAFKLAAEYALCEFFWSLRPEIAVFAPAFADADTVLFHGALIACQSFLAAECALRTCQAVYFPVSVNVNKVVCDYLKGFAVIYGGGLKAVVVVVVKEHYRLFGALAEIVYIMADILVVKGVPVIDKTVYAVGENEVEDGLFRVLMN